MVGFHCYTPYRVLDPDFSWTWVPNVSLFCSSALDSYLLLVKLDPKRLSFLKKNIYRQERVFDPVFVLLLEMVVVLIKNLC